jgi:peroxiredoxin
MKGIRLSLVAVWLSAAFACGAIAAESSAVAAPEFVLKSVSGKNYRLSEYRGQVVLLTFWASWCGECRSQLEALSEVYARFSGTGLEMLAISLDRTIDQAADSARSVGIGFPALHDSGGEIGEQYDVSRMPYVVLIDQDGFVRAEFEGFHRGDEEVYLEQVRALLPE